MPSYSSVSYVARNVLECLFLCAQLRFLQNPPQLTADTTRKVHGVTEAEQRLPRRYAPRLGGLFRPLVFLSGSFDPLHELSSGRLQGR